MKIDYSYEDYMTKGHGVIEGYHGGPKSKNVTALGFTEVASIPKNYKLFVTTLDFETYLQPVLGTGSSKDSKVILGRLAYDIQSGKNLCVGNYIISFDRMTGHYKIYSKKSAKNKKQVVAISKKQRREVEIEANYRHLLGVRKNGRR